MSSGSSGTEADSEAASLQRPSELPAALTGDPHAGIAALLVHALYDFLWLFALLVSSPWWLVRSLSDPGFGRAFRERLTLGLERSGPDGPREGRGRGSFRRPGAGSDGLWCKLCAYPACPGSDYRLHNTYSARR